MTQNPQNLVYEISEWSTIVLCVQYGPPAAPAPAPTAGLWIPFSTGKQPYLTNMD